MQFSSKLSKTNNPISEKQGEFQTIIANLKKIPEKQLSTKKILKLLQLIIKALSCCYEIYTEEKNFLYFSLNSNLDKVFSNLSQKVMLNSHNYKSLNALTRWIFIFSREAYLYIKMNEYDILNLKKFINYCWNLEIELQTKAPCYLNIFTKNQSIEYDFTKIFGTLKKEKEYYENELIRSIYSSKKNLVKNQILKDFDVIEYTCLLHYLLEPEKNKGKVSLLEEKGNFEILILLKLEIKLLNLLFIESIKTKDDVNDYGFDKILQKFLENLLTGKIYNLESDRKNFIKEATFAIFCPYQYFWNIVRVDKIIIYKEKNFYNVCFLHSTLKYICKYLKKIYLGINKEKDCFLAKKVFFLEKAASTSLIFLFNFLINDNPKIEYCIKDEQKEVYNSLIGKLKQDLEFIAYTIKTILKVDLTAFYKITSDLYTKISDNCSKTQAEALSKNRILGMMDFLTAINISNKLSHRSILKAHYQVLVFMINSGFSMKLKNIYTSLAKSMIIILKSDKVEFSLLYPLIFQILEQILNLLASPNNNYLQKEYKYTRLSIQLSHCLYINLKKHKYLKLTLHYYNKFSRAELLLKEIENSLLPYVLKIFKKSDFKNRGLALLSNFLFDIEDSETRNNYIVEIIMMNIPGGKDIEFFNKLRLITFGERDMFLEPSALENQLFGVNILELLKFKKRIPIMELLSVSNDNFLSNSIKMQTTAEPPSPEDKYIALGDSIIQISNKSLVIRNKFGRFDYNWVKKTTKKNIVEFLAMNGWIAPQTVLLNKSPIFFSYLNNLDLCMEQIRIKVGIMCLPDVRNLVINSETFVNLGLKAIDIKWEKTTIHFKKFVERMIGNLSPKFIVDGSANHLIRPRFVIGPLKSETEKRRFEIVREVGNCEVVVIWDELDTEFRFRENLIKSDFVLVEIMVKKKREGEYIVSTKPRADINEFLNRFRTNIEVFKNIRPQLVQFQDFWLQEDMVFFLNEANVCFFVKCLAVFLGVVIKSCTKKFSDQNLKRLENIEKIISNFGLKDLKGESPGKDDFNCYSMELVNKLYGA